MLQNQTTRAYHGLKLRGARLAVINRDDARVSGALPARLSTLSFGLDTPTGRDYGICQREGRNWLCRGDRWSRS